MLRRTGGVAALCAALALQGCATSMTAGAVQSVQGQALNSEARIRYYAQHQGDCAKGPEPRGGPAALPPAVALFILSTGWNLVRGELARRNQARIDEFTVTYGGRTNTTTLADPNAISCIAFQRTGADGNLAAVFELAPYVPEDRAGSPATPALVVRPVFVALDGAAARTRGANPKVNLAITVALTAVVPSEEGAKSETMFSHAFAFKDVPVGPMTSHAQLGAPSPVTPQLPASAAATIAVTVTEKGSGGEFYRDLGSALEASKDAAQTLLEHYFTED